MPSGWQGQGQWQPPPPRRRTPIGVWLGLVGVALLLVLGGTCVGVAFWSHGTYGSISLELAESPTPLTTQSEITLRGTATGQAPQLTLNGAAIPVQNGRFEHRVALRIGENPLALRLSALGKAGAPKRLERELTVSVRRVDPSEYDRKASGVEFPSRGDCRLGNSILDGAYFKCTADEVVVSAPFELGMFVSTNAQKDPSQANWRCFDQKGMTVELTLSVTSGAARAVVVDSAGQARQVEARPGAAVRLTGPTRCRAQHRGGYVRIEPTPPGSTAGGVKVDATVRFP